MSDGTDADVMRQVIERSREATEAGERPFAARLVREGDAIADGINTAESSGSPLAHAELNCLQTAIENHPPAHVAQSTLYASAEPCPMCATAAWYCGVRRVVFGVSGERLRSIIGPGVSLSCREILESAPVAVEVIGPLLEDDAAAVVRESGYETQD